MNKSYLLGLVTIYGKISQCLCGSFEVVYAILIKGEFNEETLSPKVDGDPQLEREKVYS